MQIIRTSGLTKEYKRFEKEEGLSGSFKSLFIRRTLVKRALCDFDFAVEPGEFVGLIGPNGAGKTTLVKLLTGIIRKTSGELDVLGYDPNRLENAFKRQYAIVMGQKSQLFPTLTAADTFALHKEIYEIPNDEYRRRLNQFIELFGVAEQVNVQVRTLSLGERMKMELIAALLHRPKVLFLDEPTIGLDAVAQHQIRRFLHEVNHIEGTTILLTSHYMDDIRSLCERCVVVSGGRKIYDGKMEALFERFQTKRRITVAFAEEAPFDGFGDIEVLERTPLKLIFLAPKRDAQPILREILTRYEVADIAIEEEDIGLVVERIYTEGEVTA